MSNVVTPLLSRLPPAIREFAQHVQSTMQRKVEVGGDLEGPAGQPKLRRSVLLHRLLSSSDATAGTPVKGDLIAGTGSPATWTRLPGGAGGQVIKATASAGPGMAWTGLTVTYGAAIPVFTGATSATTTVATTVLGRWLFGTVGLSSTILAAASMQIQVEDSVGAGTYTTRQTLAVSALAAGVAVVAQRAYSIVVPPGFRYRFVKGNAAGVTETIDAHNYADL